MKEEYGRLTYKTTERPRSTSKITCLMDLCEACAKDCVDDFENCRFESKDTNCSECYYYEIQYKKGESGGLVVCRERLKGEPLASGIVNPTGECEDYLPKGKDNER